MDAAPSKLWNVSATLRGFYDDNYTATSTKRDSFGFEVAPSVSANMDMRQTDIGVRYTFGLYYYQDRANQAGKSGGPIDYTHQADVWLDHAFTESLKANVSDSLVVAQDPKLMDGGATIRVQGNNLANRANVMLTKDWTREFSTETFYGNNYIHYSSGSPSSVGGVSYDALLSRIEQNVGTDFSWLFEQETTGFIGYKFSWVNYTADKNIGGGFRSDSRNQRSHYVYVGATHKFSPNLSATAKGGMTLVDLYNDPTASKNSTAPYADLSATWTFMPGSYVLAGFRQDTRSTDAAYHDGATQLTQYQEMSQFYMNLSHQFDAKLTGSLTAQYAYSKFKDGYYGNHADNEVDAGANLSYQITRNFSADVGYNFTDLLSDFGSREYSRNRVYIGVGASY